MSTYIVICLDDEGRYVHPSRRHFEARVGAEHYAATMSPTRNPIVVEIPNAEPDPYGRNHIELAHDAAGTQY